MTLRRKILLALLNLPVILFLIVLVRPVQAVDQHNEIELLFLITGLPIMLFNYLEWTDPQFLDQLFGASKLSSSLSSLLSQTNGVLGRFIPRKLLFWQFGAIMVCVLVVGFALGAGVLFFVLKPSPETAITTEMARPTLTRSADSTPVKTSTPESNVKMQTESAATVAPSKTVEISPLIAGTATATVTALPVVTTDSNRCGSSTSIQLTTIRTGIKLLDSTNDIKTGYLVKSIALDELWFFAAKVYGENFDGGVSVEPAVWSFFEKNGTPYNIYAVNDIAYQYSNFPPSQDANPPLNMQIDGANIAYECAVNGE